VELLSRLRTELARDPNPGRHVFRLTREQERAIIRYGSDLSPYRDFTDLVEPPEHIQQLLGCPVRLVD
jgi:hypothetical protein